MASNLPNVDKDTILEIAQLATKCPDLRLEAWESTTLSVQSRRSVFRFAGTGTVGGSPRPWSFVLKQIQAPQDPGAPDAKVDHCAYWEREYLLYQAGLPQTLPGDLRAPQCFGILQPAPDLRWIWLEDLHDRYHWAWPIEQFAQTAYQLGFFNGSYLATKPIPANEYLARDALRCSIEHYVNEYTRYRDPANWQHPLIQGAYPKPVIETLDRLAAGREKLLKVMKNIPHTFCHCDAWHGNMAAIENADRSTSTVLFDWALTGYGAPGEEIANLIWTAFLEFTVAIENAARLEREVFNHYLHGLADAGWQPDPNQVRLAYLIKSILLFGFQLEGVDHALDEESYAATEQFYGKPIEQLVAQCAQVTYQLIARIAELEALLDTLKL